LIEVKWACTLLVLLRSPSEAPTFEFEPI
jgi:hypothetical protein